MLKITKYLFQEYSKKNEDLQQLIDTIMQAIAV